MSHPSGILSFDQPLIAIATNASDVYSRWVDREAIATDLATNLAMWRNLEGRVGHVFDEADLPVISAVSQQAEEVLVRMVDAQLSAM